MSNVPKPAAVSSGPGPDQAARAIGLAPDKSAAMVAGLSRQNSLYRQMMAVCDRLASAAARGADAGELAVIFAQSAGKTVILLDPEFRPQAQATSGRAPGALPTWDHRDTSITRLLDVLAAERRPLRVPHVPGSAVTHGCIATPVMVADEILGYLLVLDETAEGADDADLIAVSYAATLFALTVAREQTSLELGRRYQGALVDSLVSGHFLDSGEARHKAHSLGLADAQPYRVAVTRVRAGKEPSGAGAGPGERQTAQEILTHLATSVRCPAVVRSSELVMLVPEPASPPRGTESAVPLSKARRAELPPQQSAGGTLLTSGVSELIRLPELAPRALLQAQHAIDLGIRIGRSGQVIRYEELGIYRLLLQIGDMHQLSRFAEDILGALIEYDAGHKVDLVGTLSVYLSQHESLKQTARVLRVHVNTVSYRIHRIETLASLDLSNPDHRLSAHVATKIIQSQRAGEAGSEPALLP